MAHAETARRTALLVLLLALPAAAQDTASRIQAEIRRAQQSLEQRPIAEAEYPGFGPAIGNLLQTASKALAAGFEYAALEKLGQAIDPLEGTRFADEHKAEIEKGGMSAYEALWKNVTAALDERERHVRATDWSGRPGVARALAETAWAKVEPLLDSGRGFAVALQPKDGLVYLGEAQGEAKFAEFCAALRSARKAKAPWRRSLLPELGCMQDKANAAFVPPRSIDLHPRFIQLNSALKFARELDAAKSYSGALYEYLEAVRQYGLLDATAPDITRQAALALREALADAQRKLAASGRDDSVARLFLERSQAALPEAGRAATAEEWKSAGVVVEQVVPAYLAALKPTTSVAGAPARTIEIALVRWPYT